MEIAKHLEDTDCALVSYKTNPNRYIVVKKYRNTGWVVRKNKHKRIWLTKKQALNNRCKHYILPRKKLTKEKVETLLKPYNIKPKCIMLGKQWEIPPEQPLGVAEMLGIVIITTITIAGFNLI